MNTSQRTPKRLMLMSLALCLSSFASFSQTERVWSKIEPIKPFEAKYFKEAELEIPMKIKRYYRLSDGSTVNFLNEGVFEEEDGLIEGLYTYFKTSFTGSENDFNLAFSYSAGTAHSGEGTYIATMSQRILTVFEYGTSAGTLTMKRNGKTAYQKQIDF